MPANKVLLIIGDAAEALDTMYPFFRLKEEGWEVERCDRRGKCYLNPPGTTQRREAMLQQMRKYAL